MTSEGTNPASLRDMERHSGIGLAQAALSINQIGSVVRQALSYSLEPDMIDPVIREAENDNPAAEFIVAGALETACLFQEAISWYAKSAEHGYRPALERLRQLDASRTPTRTAIQAQTRNTAL